MEVSMNKKIGLLALLIGFSGVSEGMSASRLTQTAKNAAFQAVAAFGTRFNQIKARTGAQVHNVASRAKLTPKTAVFAGSAVALATGVGVAQADHDPKEFNSENIKRYPEKKKMFGEYACEHITLQHNVVVPAIVTYIKTYPDQASTLVQAALPYGKKVDKRIRQALAPYDARFFEPASDLSLGNLTANALKTGANTVVVGGVNVLIARDMLEEELKSKPADALKLIFKEQLKQDNIAEGSAEFVKQLAAFNVDEFVVKQLKNFDAGMPAAVMGAVATNIGVGIVKTVAIEKIVHPIVGDRTIVKWIDSKAGPKTTSKCIVSLSTPLVINAYNNKFTARDNAEAVAGVVVGHALSSGTDWAIDWATDKDKVNPPANWKQWTGEVVKWTVNNFFVPSLTHSIVRAASSSI